MVLLFSGTGFPLLQEFRLVSLFKDGSSFLFIFPYVTLTVIDGCVLRRSACVLLNTFPATLDDVAVIQPLQLSMVAI